MKRDSTGKSTQTWEQEPKRAVKLSLTDTAWQLLEQQAQELNISRSELVERQARHIECRCCKQNSTHSSKGAQSIALKTTVPLVELLAEADPSQQMETLQQRNAQLQARVVELEQTITELRSHPQPLHPTEHQPLVQQPGSQDGEAQDNERHWLNAVLNLLPTPLLLIDPEAKRVTFSNRAANAIAGVDIANDVGATYNEDYCCIDTEGRVIPADHIPAVRAARGEKIFGEEVSWRTPVGTFPLLVYADVLPAMYQHPATSVVIFQNIQVRKQIEEQLRESQRLIQRVADATPGILYIYDLMEQRNVYANCQVGAVLGYTVEQVQTMGDRLFPTLMHPDDLATLPAHMERFEHAQDGAVIEREYRMRHASGEWRWLWSRDLVFSRTETGALHQILGIAHDITPRKQVELLNAQLYQAEQAARAEAQASEQRFRFLAESIPQIVWVAQANGFAEYYNQRWFDYTGLTLEASQQANGSFRHPDDHDDFGKAWVKAATNKEIFQAEQRIRRADGSYRWHLSRAYPLLDENGEIVKWFGSCTDIDDWKRMEQTQRFLAQASQTFAAASLDLQTILETVTRLASELTGDVCVLNLLTEDRKFLEHVSFYHPNPQVCAFVGELLARYPRPADEGIGGRVIQTGEPLLMPVTSQQEFSAAIKPQYRLYLERFQVCSTLLVPLKVQGMPIGLLSLTRHGPADPHTAADLNLFQDLADRAAMAIANARLYEAEQRARALAEAANRTKDEFLAVLSHELRTPMNPILGWARLLQRGNLGPGKTEIALQTIERNATLQVQLIEDLLDISRILRGKLTLNSAAVNLAAIIDAAIGTVRLAADAKGIQIKTRLAANIGSVLGDGVRLQQVVWNLLSNAVKFTPDRGQIAITLSQIGTHAHIQVKDTGKGISPEFLPLVFDTFRQADSSITRTFGGLGLGLSISRQIVELHGGTIQVESAGEGKGATFTVKLPLRSMSAAPAEPPMETNHSLSLPNVQVLAIDDEVDNLELVTFILEQAGAAVMTFTSAPEALQALPQTKPDILLLDLGMPQMDGYTLLQRIRSWETAHGNRPTPAIALTAYAGERDQQQAIKAGFQHHLSKPVEPKALIQAITKILSGRSLQN